MLAVGDVGVATTGSRYDYGDYGDGYDFAETARQLPERFRLLGGWGRDGWDLGDWPYVMVYLSADGLTVVEYVEGDLTFHRFKTAEAASAWIDRLFIYWAEDHVIDALREDLGGALPRSVSALPARFRGAFSWHRLNVSQRKACNPGCKSCEAGRDACEWAGCSPDCETGHTGDVDCAR